MNWPKLHRAQAALLRMLCALLAALALTAAPCALLAASLPDRAADKASGRESREEGSRVSAEQKLAFGGHVPEAVAAPISRALAWHECLKQTAEALASSPLLHWSSASQNERLALVSSAFAPLAQNVATRQHSIARVQVKQDGQRPEEALRQALLDQEGLELRQSLLEQEQLLAAEALDLATRAAKLRRRDGPKGDAMHAMRLAALSEQLDALWDYGNLLHQRVRARWQAPQEILPLLRKAALHSNFAPVHCALGEVLLQLDRPQDALAVLDEVLRHKPQAATAHYLRGLAHLRLQTLSLAERDLNLALELDARPAAWWRARGALHMLRNDFAAMCGDFTEACTRGDCEGIALARERQQCLP